MVAWSKTLILHSYVWKAQFSNESLEEEFPMEIVHCMTQSLRPWKHREVSTVRPSRVSTTTHSTTTPHNGSNGRLAPSDHLECPPPHVPQPLRRISLSGLCWTCLIRPTSPWSLLPVRREWKFIHTSKEENLHRVYSGWKFTYDFYIVKRLQSTSWVKIRPYF